MKAEQEQFRSWLVQQPAEEILNQAYKYAVREDILVTMEENDLPDTQAEALLNMKEPLSAVFHEFQKMETNHMDVVLESLERCSAKAAGKAQEKPPSIREQLKAGASEPSNSKPAKAQGQER